MKSFLLIIFLIFISPIYQAQALICEPCSVCALNTYGGPIQSIMQISEYGMEVAGEKLKSGFYESQEKAQKIKKYVADNAKIVSDKLGKVKDNIYENFTPESTAEDTNPPKNASVEERMKRNSKNYDSEKRGDYVGDDDFLKKRDYKQREALINYIARTQDAKSKILPELEKIVEEIDNSMKKTTSATSSTSTLESEGNQENKAKTTNDTAKFKQIHETLLKLQNRLNAIRLDYSSRKGLATQQPVKYNIAGDNSKKSGE